MRVGGLPAAVAIVVAGISGGCDSAAPRTYKGAGAGPSADAGYSADFVSIQLIVRFREGIDPSDFAFLSRLEKTLGTAIAYVRSMSGGAHVLRVSVPPDSEKEFVRRLENMPEVVDVQIDARVGTQ